MERSIRGLATLEQGFERAILQSSLLVGELAIGQKKPSF